MIPAMGAMDTRQRPAVQEYGLELVRTDAGTGFFASVPQGSAGFRQHLEALRQRPMDEFLHLFLLRQVSDWNDEKITRYLDSKETRNDPVYRALLLEALLLRDPDNARLPEEAGFLKAYSPLIHLPWALDDHRDNHRAWVEILAANILSHTPLDRQKIRVLPVPEISKGPGPVTFQALFGPPPSQRRFAPKGPEALAATWNRAVDRLRTIDALRGVEMRHTASLSPVALLHRWHLDLSVSHGRHRFRLQGEQTAYGRGLSLEAARAAWAMEMVERVSAYGRVEKNSLPLLARKTPLIQAPFSQLVRQGKNPLDPNQICLEVPYQDQRLVWMEGAESGTKGELPALIPAQCVFLFPNFDEPALFSSLGSTGLASGNTVAEARLSALMEVVERHLDAVTPFDRSRCFTLTSNDGFMTGLLADYRARGVHLQFQDIGTRLGLPCFRAFVAGRDGTIAKGTGAHLDGPRAVVSAMTETPYPYPQSPPSGPGLPGLPRRFAEQLPSLSSGSVQTDLMRMETLLRANGYRIFYADITRKDLGLPVVRAVVPGMEILGDFDRFSRIHPEAFANLLDMATD